MTVWTSEWVGARELLVFVARAPGGWQCLGWDGESWGEGPCGERGTSELAQRRHSLFLNVTCLPHRHPFPHTASSAWKAISFCFLGHTPGRAPRSRSRSRSTAAFSVPLSCSLVGA